MILSTLSRTFQNGAQRWPGVLCGPAFCNGALALVSRTGRPEAVSIAPTRRGVANGVIYIKNCFESGVIAVKSAAITTNERGSSPCAIRLSSSLSFPRLSLAACRIPHRAGLPARLPVPLSPTRLMRTLSPVPPSAVWPVRPPAGSKSVCRPATRATDPYPDLSAFGRSKPPAKTIRANRPGGLLLSRA